MYRMHHFPAHLSTAKLAGATSYPWYSSAQYNSTTPLAPLGAFWELQGDTEVAGGNAFIYVKNVGGALSVGQAVAWRTPTAGTFTLTGSTLQLIYTNITTTADETGQWLYCLSAATGGPWLRKIKAAYPVADPTAKYGANTVFVISKKDPNSPSGAADIDAIPALPSNGVAVAIIRPFQVIECTASLTPIGLALGTVADGNYTIIHVAGLGIGSAVGNGTALAVGKPAVPSAAGVLIGSAADAANLFTGGAKFVPLVATSAASALIPFEFNCIANL